MPRQNGDAARRDNAAEGRGCGIHEWAEAQSRHHNAGIACAVSDELADRCFLRRRGHGDFDMHIWAQRGQCPGNGQAMRHLVHIFMVEEETNPLGHATSKIGQPCLAASLRNRRSGFTAMACVAQ